MSTAGIVALLVLALVGHGFLWVGMINRLHGWAGPARLIDVLTFGCVGLFLLLPLGIALIVWSDGASLLWFDFASDYAAPGAVYTWLCAAIGVVNLAARATGIYRENDPRVLRQHRQELVTPESPQDRGTLVGWYPRLLGYFPGNQVLQLAVDHKQLAVPGLDERLEGLRIAHISDLHMTGRISREFFEQVADEVNRVQSDLIVVTGDIIENDTCFDWLSSSLGRLRAPLGAYFVLGNHDFYIDSQRTTQLLEEAGLTYLGGRCAVVDHQEAPILLAGNEGPWMPAVPAMAEYFAEHTGTQPLKLILLHTPDLFGWACREDADLVLAGHTHGGQVRFPGLGPVAAPSLYGTRYASGTFRREKTVMHVTRGISGETPIRWGCPPEVAVLELVRE